MSEIQQRFLSNTNYYQGNYNDYDSGYDYGGRDYNTQGHGFGYGGQGHHAAYRGHSRPIVIIQPPSQPQADPLLEGLTSLLPLAYLLPLALLATAAAPTTTVVGNGRRKRQVHGNNGPFENQDDYSVSGFDNYPTEDMPWMSSISRLVLAYECPERLACVAASPGTNNLTSGARSTARQLVTTILNTGLVTGERRGKVIRAGSIGRLWPQHCMMYKCID